MPILETAAAVAGGVGAVTEGVSGFFGGGDDSGSRFSFENPEQEIQFINQFEADLASIENDIGRFGELERNFNQRLDFLDQGISGLIPSQSVIEGLRDTTFQLTQALGEDAIALADAGFLTDDVRQELDDLRSLESKRVQDPRLKADQEERKRELIQNLVRGGANQDVISQALAKLDEDFESESFQRSEQLKELRFGRGIKRIGTRVSATESGFNRATGSLGALGEVGDTVRADLNSLFAIADARRRAGAESIAGQSSLRGERQEGFKTLGQTNFSDVTQKLVEGGFVGPGTVRDQTGVARRDAERVGGRIAQLENFISQTERSGSVRAGGFDASVNSDALDRANKELRRLRSLSSERIERLNG